MPHKRLSGEKNTIADPLKILVVEDNPDDAELQVLRLKREGFQFEYLVVQTEAGYIQALEHPYDLILSDWTLPQFSGMKALQILNQKNLQIPFIILSGNIGEEAAVEALHLGAYDYVLKDRPDRLGQAVRNALEQADLRRANAEAQAMLRLQSSALDAAANAIVIIDPSGKIQWMNPAFTAMTGYTAEESLGKRVVDLVYSGHHDEAFYRTFYETTRAGKSWRGEFVNRHKDGSIFIDETVLAPLQNEQGEITHFVAIKQDSTERKLVEKTLLFLANQPWLSSGCDFFEALGCFLMEATGVGCACMEYQQANGAGVQTLLLCRDEPAEEGKPFQNEKRSHPGEFCTSTSGLLERLPVLFPQNPLLPRLQAENSASVVLRNSRGEQVGLISLLGWQAQGQRRLLERLLELVSVSVAADVERRHADAENERLQRQLLQANKMESIGRLAGGVAHDFNNWLGVIMGNAERGLARLGPEEPTYGDLEKILGSAQRASTLVQQLLAFARKQAAVPRALDLNETIAGMLSMFRQIIGEDIELVWQPGELSGCVNLDPSQLDQVIANLLVNARDAIRGAGKIVIETRQFDCDDAFCAQHPFMKPGEYVQLNVQDNGHGMDEETLTHLFEPFFTTKSIGKGTGLGLATVYGIVKQGGGFIDVSSQPGAGTTFTLYWPRIERQAETNVEAAPRLPAAVRMERILLVEDEPALLDLVKDTLEDEGYEVMCASAPGAAIQLVQEFPGQIDLVITDLIMPEMNGRMMVERIREFKQGFQALYMSGYSNEIMADRNILTDGSHFIQKPFMLDALLEKIARLESPAEAS